MIDAPISMFFTGILAGMLAMLSGPVSMRRIATRTTLGEGTDPLLQRLIRAQGNFIEFAPIGLFAVFMVEVGGGRPGMVWTLAGLLLAGRLIHAAGMITHIVPGRMAGMILTYASLGGSAVFLLSRGVPAS